MTDREPEAGHELVLDNRKLIIAFAVLIAICGAFFVLGFMEGRRQGFQDGMQTEARRRRPEHRGNPRRPGRKRRSPRATSNGTAA
jgi:hypothetical protein